MVYTTVTPRNTHIELDIPAEYVGKEIEITLSPVKQMKEKSSTMGSFWGIISDKTAQEMHDNVKKNREEWERDI